MGESRGAYSPWGGNLREGENLEYPGLDKRMILNWMLKSWIGRHELD
jgi:hypothetical protein